MRNTHSDVLHYGIAPERGCRKGGCEWRECETKREREGERGLMGEEGECCRVGNGVRGGKLRPCRGIARRRLLQENCKEHCDSRLRVSSLGFPDPSQCDLGARDSVPTRRL